MSHPSRCCFCEKLPVVRKRSAGQAAKCPACLGELVVWPTGGTYRLASPKESTQEGRRGQALVVAGVAAAVLLAVTLGAAALLHQPDESAATGQVIPVQPTPHSAPAPAQPAAVIKNKDAVSQAAAARPVKSPPSDADEAACTKACPSERTVVGIAVAPDEPPLNTATSRYPWASKSSAEDVRSHLLEIAEVWLEDPADMPKKPKEARLHIQKQVKEIAELIAAANDPAAFVQQLIDKRPDLAGMSWRKGKDCQLTPASAVLLRDLSVAVHGALHKSMVHSSGQALKAKSSDTERPGEVFKDVSMFWSALNKLSQSKYTQLSAIGPMKQILTAEITAMRISFVEHLGRTDGTPASETIAELAVFDINPEVRATAIKELKARRVKEYLPVLLQAFRYPWPAAAQHAAETLVELNLTEALPALAEKLDELDAETPFLKSVRGKPTVVVREMVRVNHLRNCLLCHAPAVFKKDVVRGAIPTPGQELPVGYRGDFDEPAVQAEVTYLQQDFSVMLPVKDSGAWPTYQRYDFLVRVRPLTDAELIVFERREIPTHPPAVSARKQAILFALCALTGQDTGPTTREWKELLRTLRQDQFNP